MQYIPCNSALLAQETLLLTQKGTFLPKDLQKVRESRQIFIREKQRMFGLKIFVRVQTVRRVPPVLPCNFCHPVTVEKTTDYIVHQPKKDALFEKLSPNLAQVLKLELESYFRRQNIVQHLFQNANHAVLQSCNRKQQRAEQIFCTRQKKGLFFLSFFAFAVKKQTRNKLYFISKFSMSKLGIISFRVMAVFILQDIGGHNFQGELLHSSYPKHPVVFGKPIPLDKQTCMVL